MQVNAAPAVEAVVEPFGAELADGEGLVELDVGEGLGDEFVTVTTLPATGQDAPATTVALRPPLGDADGVCDGVGVATAADSAFDSTGGAVKLNTTIPSTVSTPAAAIAPFAVLRVRSRAHVLLRKTSA